MRPPVPFRRLLRVWDYLFGNATASPPPRVRLGFEPMEDRTLLTAVPLLAPDGGTWVKVDSITVATKTNQNVSTGVQSALTLEAGKPYLAVARGEARIATDATGFADAEFIRYNKSTGPQDGSSAGYPWANHGVRLSGVPGGDTTGNLWGGYQADHQYVTTFVGQGTKVTGYYTDAPGYYGDNSGTLTVDLYAAVPTVGVTATNTAEGAETGGFTFTRAGSAAESLTVFYAVGGTATPGADYSPLSGTVTFPAGQTSVYVRLRALPDNVADDGETVAVSIIPSAAYSAPPASRTATALIADWGTVDLDVDSDNNNGFAPPDRTDQEDAAEDVAGDAAKPGKLVVVNDEDKDGDFVPDFADGYGLNLAAMGATDKAAVALANAAEQFVPVVLTLPTGSIDLSQAVVVIGYDGSDPLAVTYDPATDVYSPAPGSLRLWAKPGAALRNGAAFNKSLPTGGDYLAPGTYTLAQLGLDPAATVDQTITFYLEAVQASAAAGDARITVTLDGEPAGIGNLTDAVRVTATDLDIERKTGAGWEDAGDVLARYRTNPVVTVIDLTRDDLAGAATYQLTEHAVTARDRLGTVNQIDVSVDGGAWTPLGVSADGTEDGVFSSSVTQGYELTGLDTLLTRDLGTRRRYLFRATNSAGRTGYEELVLEVRFDTATGRKYIAPINLGVPSDAQPDPVPSESVYRFRVAPALAAGGDAVLTLPTPLWMNGPDGNAKAWSSLTLDQVGATEFVVVDAAGGTPAGEPTLPHFRRDATNSGLAAEYAPIPAHFPNAKVADKATAAYFDLAAFGADDNTEVTNPSTVRYNPAAVAPANFAQNKYLMQPLKVAATVPAARGTVSVRAATIDVGLWTTDGKEVFPATDVPAAELTAADPTRRFLVGGVGKNATSDVYVEYKYRGRVIQTDQVRYRVTDVSGLAGIPLSGAPDFQYVHTFNATQPVSVALDPGAWSQLTGYETLAGGPNAKFLITSTRTPADWAADGAFESKAGPFAGKAAVVITSPAAPLSAASLAANTRTLAGAPVGQYDVVIDIADDKGEPGPNGRLDPGDIVGVFTTTPDGAEVQVVDDPLTKVAAYGAGYIDYGSSGAKAAAADKFTTPAGYDGGPAAAVADNWIHGRVYYPTPLAGAGGKDAAAAAGAFPLVVILHGRHIPRSVVLGAVPPLTVMQANAITKDENYLGYTFLQERLAQQGYASVSVDLDRYFSWESPAGLSMPGILARAYAAAKNVDRVRTLNAVGSGSKIEGHIDFSNVTLLGHSRGGEAVVELANMVDTSTGPFAAAAPGGNIAPFTISRVISLAPTAIQETSVGSRPYLVILGGADGDLFKGDGLKLYDAARAATIKASLFVPGVSHNLFNRSWPYNDADKVLDVSTGDIVPLAGGLGTLGGGTVGAYSVGGGLQDRTYHENLLTGYTLAWIWGGAYLEYFNRPAAQIGPKLSAAAVPNPIVTQFHRSTARVVDDFQAKPAFGGISSGGSTNSDRLVIPAAPAAAVDTPLDNDAEGYYQGKTEKGVELAWDNKARGGTGYYEQAPTGSIDASGTRFLSFRAGLHRSVTTPTSLTVELIDGAGNSVYFDVARLGGLATPYAARFGPYKVDPDDITKTAMQTYRVDLAALKTNGRAFDLSGITKVRFVFDRTATGRAIFDDIEFSN